MRDPDSIPKAKLRVEVAELRAELAACQHDRDQVRALAQHDHARAEALQAERAALRAALVDEVARAGVETGRMLERSVISQWVQRLGPIDPSIKPERVVRIIAEGIRRGDYAIGENSEA